MYMDTCFSVLSFFYDYKDFYILTSEFFP